MTQETRKDPRAKVLTMTVRYKSATLDEFIEHHSYDVSRGGMFIKTPSPFPPGTLLKFEVKISGEQRVMQGVGRVVWKRESSEVSEARPAGMGVKFIKIDDDSRKVIDQLVAARGDGASAFDQGADASGARQPPARDIPSQVVAPSLSAREPLAASSKPRKATMLGLGAMQAEPESPETAAAEAFFPPAQPDQPVPAPEDRTVMKQAAELLQDALREAGGSLEEVGSTKESPTREAPKAADRTPIPGPAPLPKVEAAPPPAPSRAAEKAEKATEKAGLEKAPVEKAVAEKSVIVNARPRDEVTQPAVRRASVAPAARRSEPPKARSAAIQEAAGAAADSGGGGRFFLALVAVAAVGAGIYFLKQSDAPPPEPPAPAAEAPPPAPEPTPPPTAAQAPAEPTAAATASAAPGTSASAIASAAPAPSAVPEQKPAASAAPAPAKPAPAVKTPKPIAKPASKPPTAETTAAPAEPTPPTPPVEPVAPTAAPPTAQPAPEAPKPPAAPKPKTPKPAPTDTSGDNPY